MPFNYFKLFDRRIAHWDAPVTTMLVISPKRKRFWRFILEVLSHQFLFNLTVSVFFEVLFRDNFISGGQTENFEFKINDDTQVYESCSSVLNGELFVFGGQTTSNNRRKQVKFKSNSIFSGLNFYIKVSKVIGCELKRIGDLSYEFDRGACGTFKFPEERVMLCFSEAYRSKCER